MSDREDLEDPEAMEPDFARETKVVDFGRNLPPAQAYDVAKLSTPIPELITVRVVVMKGDASPAMLKVTKPYIILGRVEGVADVALEAEGASRYHAFISHQAGSFFLYDMGSTNGTYVNGKPVSKVEIKDGDQIRIDTTVLRFDIRAAG